MEKSILKDELLKLDKGQLKLFYSVLVHYWIRNRSFISKQNFFNLWCQLNEYCCESDESFPDPHDDQHLMTSFCQSHPFLLNKFIKQKDIESPRALNVFLFGVVYEILEIKKNI